MKPVPPGEGRVFTARGSRMMFKAVAAETGGDFSLMERTLQPRGRRPPMHRHTNCSEAFFVLDGEVVIAIDDDEYLLGPEEFVLVPRGARHTFGCGSSSVPARLLVLHAPAMDAYFAELDQLWSGPEPPTPDQERELMGRYGMEP
jgi:mannose-6-phosphate isomerase-like protein (cupin superfamily)